MFVLNRTYAIELNKLNKFKILILNFIQILILYSLKGLISEFLTQISTNFRSIFIFNADISSVKILKFSFFDKFKRVFHIQSCGFHNFNRFTEVYFSKNALRF